MENIKKELFLYYAKHIKDLGYKVFVTNREFSNYGWIVNEKDEVGYFQLGDFGYGVTFSTVHKPCYEFGSGFGLDDWDKPHKTFTKEIVDRCFAHHPYWAKGKLSQIRKYTATEYFANYWDKKNIIEI